MVEVQVEVVFAMSKILLPGFELHTGPGIAMRLHKHMARDCLVLSS